MDVFARSVAIKNDHLIWEVINFACFAEKILTILFEF